MKIQKNRAIYIGLLTIVWACAYIYIFNEKIDINGDNCRYYTFASSLASGQGYADISAPTPHPTNAFPPGYPLLMTPLRFFTDSIIAQKILNGLFLPRSDKLGITVMAKPVRDTYRGHLDFPTQERHG